MKAEILSEAAKRKILFSPDAMEMILSNSDPMAFTNTVFSHLASDMVFVSKKDIMDCIAGDSIMFQSPKETKPRNRFTPDIHVIGGTDVTGESTCEGKINDFANLMMSRFQSLKKILMKNREMAYAVSLEKAKTMNRDCHVVVMIYEKSTTKNGHIMLSVEDDTDTAKILVSKDSPLIDELLIDDEVIGVAIKSTGKSKDLFIADKIIWPDVPKGNAWEPGDQTSKIAFLSDVHVGSTTFLEPAWKRMTSWLRANAEKNDINYLVFPGDVVDGIGVFPDQDKELIIADIYEQYEKLAEYLKDIPDGIKMVIHPGNHDAARLAEPQPALNKKFTGAFDSDVLMLGNPVYLSVEGRTVLTYHGKSMDDWIAGVRGMSYDDPLKVMRSMCKTRHLAPIYGQRNALAPEKRDYLVMEYVPEIFVSGHVHGAGQEIYNGIRMINASTWQSQTEYQKMHNFIPDPAIMPVVDLGDGSVLMHNFMRRSFSSGN